MELQRELGCSRKIRLLLGDADTMPMVWNVGRPSILLPRAALGWAPTRVRGVLLHELAHLRRGDLLARLVAQLALAAHWFNPLAWLAVRQLRAEQGRACDDCVLRHGLPAGDYAHDLLALAKGLREQSGTAVALTMAHRARMEGRIAGILDVGRDRRALTRGLALTAALLAAAIALPLAMLRAEEEKAADTEPRTAVGGPPMIIYREGEERELPETARITSVTTTADAAEITVVEKQGHLAIVAGEGEQARVIVHRVSKSRVPLVFRIGADDRQGKWWDQVRIVRAGEAEALLPVLPDDWLPRGRVVFLPTPAKAADGRMVFAEIETSARKIPLAVLPADAREIDKASSRHLPRTSPELEIKVDARLHALREGAPEKAVKLPVMAAQNLVGVPREALSRPYVTAKPGFPANFDRLNGRAERVDVTATLESGGVHVEGAIAVPMPEEEHGSAREAWRQREESLRDSPREPPPLRWLRAAFTATLGRNDALVVPIASEGLFPETLVLSCTALSRRLSRIRWLPPGTRSPIQFDGWVLTWPRAEHEWFAQNFDYRDGVPAMISRHLKRRSEPPPGNAVSSETVGMLRAGDVEKLVAAFRQRASVAVVRVEPFSIPQDHASPHSVLHPTPFSPAGEPASLSMHTHERHISPAVKWHAPVFKHLNAGGGWGVDSGDSLCVLLPGPAEPQDIRLLLLRCVNPDAEPRATGSAR